MNKREFLKMMSASAVVGLAGGYLSQTPKDMTAVQNQETSYDRIIRTGTIRCAYAVYEPATMIDPITRQMSGLYYDITNLIGQYLGFKVDWTEEVGWGSIIEGFKAGRYELFGSSLFPTPQRSVSANFSIPAYFSPIYIYVRPDDKRFENYDDINQPSIRVSLQDGDAIDAMVKVSFPRATRVSLPQTAQTKQRYFDVMTGKADVTLDEPLVMEKFLKQYPGALKRLSIPMPLRVLPATLMFDDDDFRLKKMFDVAMFELHNAGIVQKLIDKYTDTPGSFLLPNDFYKTGV